MTKCRSFLYRDILIAIIPPNADIFKWPRVCSSMRNCTLKPQSHFAVVCLWCSDPTPLSSGKAAVLTLFLFLEVSLGEPKYDLQTLVFKIFFFLFIFFFLGLLCLHRKFWIGIFVSFYSKFLLSHPPNLEPETTILPHPNSAGRPFNVLGMSYSPKCSFLSFRQLWQSSDLWSW